MERVGDAKRRHARGRASSTRSINGANFQVLHEFDTAHYATDGYAPYARLRTWRNALRHDVGRRSGWSRHHLLDRRKRLRLPRSARLDNSSLHEGSSSQAGLILGADGLLSTGWRSGNIRRRDDLPD